MIRLTDVYKTYKMGDVEVNALDGINLHIEKHEFTAIVGPSGSGKSTLMNILGCLDIPTRGTYELNGKEVGEMRDDELAKIRSINIGFIFQGFNLLQKLTAIDNVCLPLIYQGVKTKERHARAAKVLEKVGLGDRIHHKPSQLSGGQQQRVAIARALVTNPSIILADEPTGNLDSKSGAEIMTMLKEIHHHGNTVILITHDNHIAMEANRVIRIQDGQIEEVREAQAVPQFIKEEDEL